MSNEEYAALNAKLDRMLELIQQEFLRQREELDQFRAQVNTRFDDVNTRFDDVYARFDDVYARFDDVYARFDGVNARLDNLDTRIDSLRVEMAERFQSVLDRLDDVERQSTRTANAVKEMREDLEIVRRDVLALQGQVDQMHKSVHGVGDDMRQRFRLVNERLAAVEKRLAA